MPQRLSAWAQKTICFFVCLIMGSSAFAQCTLNNLEKVTLPNSEWIAGGYFKGLLRKLPADYNSNPTKKYPVIIYFHGKGAMGDGTQQDLCKVWADGNTSLPGRIENNQFPLTVTSGGQSYSFIVLMPQYTSYDEPPYYADKVDAFLDYALANYRIDPTRVYLTGMSAGANHVIDYVSSSAARAQRIAAVSMASMCWNLTWNPTGPANIAAAALPTWFVHCAIDDPCVVGWPDAWVDGINNQPGAVAARYNRLEKKPSPQPHPWGDQQAMQFCQSFAHDTWVPLYNPTYTPDGGPNLATWSLQYSRAALPVRLKDFTARLTDGKVYLQWATLSETDNAHFTIERAGADGRYTTVTTIPAKGNGSLERTYNYVDERPLSQLSHYRLVQTDIDGDKEYLATRSVVNRQGVRQLVILGANPFQGDVSAYINVDKPQKVMIELTDMSGKKLASNNALYTQGVTEVTLPAAHLPRGVYLLKAAGESLKETYKIVKQ